MVLETKTWYIVDSRLFEAVRRVRQKATKALLDKFMSELATNVGKIGELSYAHYDLAMQALAKIERGFSHDLADAAALISNRYITAEQLRERFAQIQPHMIRYPAIDEQAFTMKLETSCGQ